MQNHQPHITEHDILEANVAIERYINRGTTYAQSLVILCWCVTVAWVHYGIGLPPSLKEFWAISWIIAAPIGYLLRKAYWLYLALILNKYAAWMFAILLIIGAGQGHAFLLICSIVLTLPLHPVGLLFLWVIATIFGFKSPDTRYKYVDITDNIPYHH